MCSKQTDRVYYHVSGPLVRVGPLLSNDGSFANLNTRQARMLIIRREAALFVLYMEENSRPAEAVEISNTGRATPTMEDSG